MKGFVNDLYDINRIEIPDDMLKVCVDEQRVEEEIQKLSLRFAKETMADLVEKGDVVYCQADKESYPDGRTILVYTGLDIPGTETAIGALVGKKPGDVAETVICKNSVTLTIKKIIHRTPVDVDDALIADMGIDGVNTVEDYRNDVRMQMIRDLLMEKKKMATKYIIDQLLEKSTYSYDEAMMDAYVDSMMPQYMKELEEFGETMSEEEVRASIIDQCKENWMAQAFCKQHGVEIDEAAVDEEVGRMIEMMELTGEPVSDRDEIREMMLQNEYFNGLIGHINRIIEQKAGEVCGSC